MATEYRGITTNIKADTSYLKTLAAGFRTAANSMDTAAAQANKARRHEGWDCNEKHNVEVELNYIRGHSGIISNRLNAMAKIVEDSVSEFEERQVRTLSTMTSPELMGG